MIQRNYKASVWVRIMNRLIKQRKEAMCLRIQRYLKSYISFKKVMKIKRDKHLVQNFQYFDDIRTVYLVDAQIKIRWAWKLKQRRKAIALQKKKEAEDAKNARLYGRGKKKVVKR